MVMKIEDVAPVKLPLKTILCLFRIF